MDERRFNARGILVIESEATATLTVGGQDCHEVAVGNGPVNALDTAIRKALVRYYPAIGGMRLVDYKVRILPPSRDGDGDRTSVVEGKRGAVRVGIGGRRNL